MTTNDADWVADVRRWYFSGLRNLSAKPAQPETDTAEMGYEAAHPALQSQHWPEAPRTGITDLR